MSDVDALVAGLGIAGTVVGVCLGFVAGMMHERARQLLEREGGGGDE